jgi:hypothetical protein
MIIEADGYAYWCGYDVKVGDTVRVSISRIWGQVFGGAPERTVTSLTSDYDGPCERVISVIKKSEKT